MPPTLVPKYRARLRDPQPTDVIDRYRRVRLRLTEEQRRRRLVAVGPGLHVDHRPRPAWLSLVIDWVATPALWTVLVLMVASGEWWLAIAGLLHLAAVAAFIIRPGSR